MHHRRLCFHRCFSLTHVPFVIAIIKDFCTRVRQASKQQVAYKEPRSSARRRRRKKQGQQEEDRQRLIDCLHAEVSESFAGNFSPSVAEQVEYKNLRDWATPLCREIMALMQHERGVVLDKLLNLRIRDIKQLMYKKQPRKGTDPALMAARKKDHDELMSAVESAFKVAKTDLTDWTKEETDRIEEQLKGTLLQAIENVSCPLIVTSDESFDEARKRVCDEIVHHLCSHGRELRKRPRLQAKWWETMYTGVDEQLDAQLKSVLRPLAEKADCQPGRASSSTADSLEKIVKATVKLVNKLSQSISPSRLKTAAQALPAFRRKQALGRQRRDPDVPQDTRVLVVQEARGNAEDSARLAAYSCQSGSQLTHLQHEQAITVDSVHVEESSNVIQVHASTSKQVLRKIGGFTKEYHEAQNAHGQKTIVLDPIVTASAPFSIEDASSMLEHIAYEPSQERRGGIRFLAFLVVVERDAAAVRELAAKRPEVVPVVIADSAVPCGREARQDKCKMPHANWLVDMMKLLGEWLCIDFKLPYYVRMLSTICDLREATEVLHGQPSTVARVLTGLRCILEKEEESQRRDREERLWGSISDVIETNATGQKEKELLKQALKIGNTTTTPSEALQKLQRLANIPDGMKETLRTCSAARVSSCSVPPSMHGKVNWVNMRNDTVADNYEASSRANYTVHEYDRKYRSYSQTALVFNNTACQKDVYCASRNKFVGPEPVLVTKETQNKLVKAEGALAKHILNTGQCCILTDQFTVRYAQPRRKKRPKTTGCTDGKIFSSTFSL